MRWLLYGSYGYTGQLVTRVAREKGLEPILAGRDPARTAEAARSLGLEHRSFALDDRGATEDALADVDLVLSTAGPFSRTFEPLAAACLERGCHYLDVTGELEVFEAAYGLARRAREAGVVLLPGVGFDVVASDCAAVRAAGGLERPTRLDLAIHGTGGVSRGTLLSVLEGLSRPAKLRRDGRIVDVPHGSLARTVPFADGDRRAVCIPWGDVSTAYRSTGVPNVRVFMTVPGWAAAWAGLLSRILRLPGALAAASFVVKRLVGGPRPEEQEEAEGRIWCEARDEEGAASRCEIVTPGTYLFTAESAVAAVVRFLEGRLEGRPSGFHTPTTAFGAGFVDEIPGVRWVRP